MATKKRPVIWLKIKDLKSKNVLPKIGENIYQKTFEDGGDIICARVGVWTRENNVHFTTPDDFPKADIDDLYIHNPKIKVNW